ncbi:MAG TPA: hypothetical protein VL261_00925 [Nitrospira sp.]|jgi:hypothetical protein|nr:hypothetical protein [Nitrospira sp.]
MPGRVRLHMPALRHQPERVAHLKQKLQAVKGIHHVEGSATTGNVTVHYDAAAVQSLEFLGEVAGALGLMAEGIDPSAVKDLFELVGVTPSMLIDSLKDRGFLVPLATFAAGWFIGTRLA